MSGPRHLALVLALLALPVVATTAAAEPRRLVAEPGHPLASGDLLVPVTALDDAGRPVPLAPDDLRVRAGDADLAVRRLEAAAPAAVLVISDRGLPADAWPPLAASLAWLGVRGADPKAASARPLAPWSATAAAPDLAEPPAPRVWDAILAGLESLAVADDAPARRVILVIGDLRDDAASAHPVATCVEAARELAIPVYGVALPSAAPAARARLTRLAGATGGDAWSATDPAAALAAGLARVAAAQGLVLDEAGLALPATAIITVGEARAETRLLSRPRGRWAPGPGLIAAAVVLLAALAGLLAWRQWRRRAVGYLEAAGPEGASRRAIPAGGLTIGRAPDNGLVVAENQVSKHHALVRWHRGQVQLVDLRSTNGTQVAGRPIRSAALRDGDVVTLGDAVSFVFRGRRAEAKDRV